MEKNNKADTDPFTKYGILLDDQNLLIGTASRNNDHEMDIILGKNYSKLEALERIAIKNYAAQQARAQGI